MLNSIHLGTHGIDAMSRPRLLLVYSSTGLGVCEASEDED
jgi:hypothetical protein